MNTTLILSRGGAIVKKHLPTILTWTGTGLTLAGTFLACKATYHVDEVLDEHKETMAKIEGAHDGTIALKEGAEYTNDQYKKDVMTAKVNTGKKLAKLYWPAGVTIIGGIACILGGHGILSKRNAALGVAYTALDSAFHSYRNGVVEKFGEEVDKTLRFGLKDDVVAEEKVDEETGEVTTEETQVKVPSVNDAIYFSSQTSAAFTGNFLHDYNYLKVAQQDMTDRLRMKGHLTLNDVLRRLGMDDTDEGMQLGWVMNGDGDTYVDFGIVDRATGDPKPWVMLCKDCIPLDMNYDGIIYGKLKLRGNVR